MASADRLRRELTAARYAAEVSRRYGGARVVMTGIGVRSIDFSTSSDPGRYWCRWRDDREAGAVFLLRGQLVVADPLPLEGERRAPWIPGCGLFPEQRAEIARLVADAEAKGVLFLRPYDPDALGEYERHYLEAGAEAERRYRETAAADARALAAPENRPPLAPEPAPIVPRTGAELDFMDKSSAPALPPRRRSRTGARVEPVQGSGGLTGKLTRA